MSGPVDPKSQIARQIDAIDVDPWTKTVAKAVTALGGNPVPILISGLAAKMTNEKESANPLPEVPADYSKTEKVLASMLWENTGAHPLDSGSMYGRFWERNRKIRDFRALPVVEADEDYVHVNVFHYLSAFLERDDVAEELESRFYQFAELPKNQTKPWLTLMIDFAHGLEEEGWRYMCADNSANWVHHLSQDLQFVLIEDKNENRYIILQIHNGADIRGGYTKPRFFKINVADPDEFLYMMDEISASCGCTPALLKGESWERYTDDGTERGFPEAWEWDKDKKMWVCRHCNGVVEFHSPIEDL
jgi:hypothetical protein